MAYEQREGQGSLFKNDKLNDRQPDYRGSIMIGGKMYEVAAWARTSQNGRQYLSLQASEPDPNRQSRAQQGQGGGYQQPRYQQAAPQQAPAPAPSYDDMPPAGGPYEDLPF